VNSRNVRAELSQKLFALLSEVTGGALDGDRIAADAEFTDTGMSSIEYLALVEKIETTFDVVIDLEDGSLTSVDSFLDVLVAQGESA
jgi:acyl carrier protein